VKFWRLAWRNLGRTRRRNLATASAIAVGCAGLVILGWWVTRVEAFLRSGSVYLDHRGHVLVYKEGGLERAAGRPARYSLSREDQAAILGVIRGDARVDFTARYLRGMGLAGNGCRTTPFIGLGVEPAVETRVVGHPSVVENNADFARPVKGSFVSERGDVPGAVAVSAGLARLLGKRRVHDEVEASGAATAVPDCASEEAPALIAADANVQLAGMTFDGGLSAIDGEIVGIFHAATSQAEDMTLVTSLASLQELYATDAVTYVAVYLRDWRQASTVAAELQGRLRASGLAVSVYPFTDEKVNPFYAGTMAFLGSLVTFITLLVTSVVVLGVMNAVTLTVFERTREIGTFRALGYTRRQVAGIFLREIVLLSCASVGAGVAGALVVSAVVNAANIRFSPPGIPGTVQVLLLPSWPVVLAVASLLGPLAVLVTYAVARRRAALRTADLLTATTA